MQAAQTPSSTAFVLVAAPRIITLLRTGSGLFSSTTSGSSATPHPAASPTPSLRARRRWRRSTRLLTAPPKPQLDAPTYRPWSAMIKGIADQSGRSTVTRCAPGREGPGQLTPRRGSPQHRTPPTLVESPAYRHRASQVGFAGDDLLHKGRRRRRSRA